MRSLLPSSIPTNAADAAWNLPTAPARKRWTLIRHRRFSRLLGIGFYWLARAKPGRETRCAHGDRSMWATAARTGLRCASLAARSRAPRGHLRRGSFSRALLNHSRACFKVLYNESATTSVTRENRALHPGSDRPSMDVPAFSGTNLAALMASLAALRRTLPGSDSPRPCARPCSS